MNRIVEAHVAAVLTGVPRDEAKKALFDAEIHHLRELQHRAMLKPREVSVCNEKIRTSPSAPPRRNNTGLMLM